MHTDPADEFAPALRALDGAGWCVLPAWLTPQQTGALGDECHAMHAALAMQPARVGAAHTVSLLRGDHTRWFEPLALTPAQQVFVTRIERLRIALNRNLLLGLVDSESHYAVYPPGAGYARHCDCLRDDDARVLSLVFYLNDGWLDSEGGALRLHLADCSPHDVYPRAGTLLLFLSAQFEHEVLPATRQRMSIASWMRQRVPDAS